jgi:hypothetical protein
VNIPRLLLGLYPRQWRERYGDELLLLLGERLRPGDVVDVILGALNEWTVLMTGVNRWNDQAQRTTKALAQAACGVIAFQTFMPAVVSALFGGAVYGAQTLWQAFLFGFLSSLLQSAVTLGPVALLSSLVPWHRVPHARVAAGLTGAFVSFRIATHIAWGPIELALILAGFWIGYKAAHTPQDIEVSVTN